MKHNAPLLVSQTDQPAFDYDRAFSRNLGLLSSAEQNILSNKRIAIPGCGGVGGIHAHTLARMGVGHFSIADFDTYEIENMNRQFGARVSTLGDEKVKVIAADIMDINPQADVRVFEAGIGEAQIAEFLDGVHLVIDSLDFFAFEARELLFTTAFRLGIPVVTAAPLGFSCALLIFAPGRMTYRDYFNIKPGDSDAVKAVKFLVGLAPKGTHRSYIDTQVIDFVNMRGPSSAIGVTMCASMAGAAAIRILLGRGHVSRLPGYTQFDAYKGLTRSGVLRFGNRGPIQRLKIILANKDIKKRVLRQTGINSSRHLRAVDNNSNGSRFKSIVQKALRAPSGDNCQPWQFMFSENRVEIFHNEMRGRHALNRSNHASIIALGCLIEAINLLAQCEGYEADVRLLDLGSKDKNTPWAELTFAPTEKHVEKIAGSIEGRFTDRRAFLGGSLDHWAFKEIRDDFAANDSCRIRFTNDFKAALLTFICKSETMVWRHRSIHQNLFEWLRFSKAECLQNLDGMPWQSTGLNFLESRFLKICRNYAVQKVANQLGFLKKIEAVTAINVTSSAGLGLVTTTRLDPPTLVTVGRLTYRSWLRLHDAGFGFQPLTLASLGLFDRQMQGLPNDVADELGPLYTHGVQVLRDAFNLTENEVPVWMFRTGVSQGPVAGGKTLRMDLKRLIKDLP